MAFSFVVGEIIPRPTSITTNTEAAGHQMLMTTQSREASGGQARQSRSGLQPSASRGILLLSPHFGKLRNLPDSRPVHTSVCRRFGALEALDYATSCRCLAVQVLADIGRSSAGQVVQNTPEAPSLGQAVQEIHGLEEIARTLERSKPTLVDRDDLSGAIQARQHAIDR
jgi:hypothetical protein